MHRTLVGTGPSRLDSSSRRRRASVGTALSIAGLSSCLAVLALSACSSPQRVSQRTMPQPVAPSNPYASPPAPPEQASQVVPAPPTRGTVETAWTSAESFQTLQAIVRDVIGRTRAQLGSSRSRGILCGAATTTEALQTRAQAMQSLLLPVHPLLTRVLQNLIANDASVRALVGASESLLSRATPVVPNVNDGLMWVLAEIYARGVCAADADIPALAVAVLSMANEDAFVRDAIDTIFTTPIIPPATAGRYWTKRDDLIQLATATVTLLAAPAPSADEGAADLVDPFDAASETSTVAFAQASVQGAPFACDGGALRAFDRGGPGNDNRIHESGEVFGLVLRCRNTSGQRMMSQSIILGESIPQGFVVGREEVVVAEVAAGEEFDLPISPLYVATSAGARPDPLALRVVSSRASTSGTLELRFQPLTFALSEATFTSLDEDLSGASEPDDVPNFGPNDQFETQLRIRATDGFTPSITNIALAHEADEAIFTLGTLSSEEFVAELAADPGTFVSLDDLDGRVASRDACAALDTYSPIPITRVPGRRFVSLDLRVVPTSPLTLALIARQLAPISMFAAASTLGQRQEISTFAAWNALRSAGGRLQPAAGLLARWKSERDSNGGLAPASVDLGVVAQRVKEAVELLRDRRIIDTATRRALIAQFPAPCPESAETSTCGAPRSDVRIDPGTLSRFMLLCHALGERDANSECEGLLRAMATPTSSVPIDQLEARIPLARRIVRWAEIASAFGTDAGRMLVGVDVRTNDAENLFENETVLRNALVAALDTPLGADAAPAAAPVAESERQRRRRERREGATATTAAAVGAPTFLRAVAFAATKPVPPLPTWSASRYVSLILEGNN